MLEFIRAALPWVLMGVSIAILVVNAKKYEGNNYMTEGRWLGLFAGITVGTMGFFSLGIGIALGMLAGEAIGCLIRKQ